MVLGIENWPNNVTGLFFASRLGYMLHGFVYTFQPASETLPESYNLTSKVLNEQKIDLSDCFSGWQHIRQRES